MLLSALNRSTLGNKCTIITPPYQVGTLRHGGEMTCQGCTAGLWWDGARRAVFRDVPGVATQNWATSK